jgi:hypothetical protein
MSAPLCHYQLILIYLLPNYSKFSIEDSEGKLGENGRPGEDGRRKLGIFFNIFWCFFLTGNKNYF